MTLSELSTINLPIEIEENRLNTIIEKNFKPVNIGPKDRVTGVNISGEGKRVHLKLKLEGRYDGLVNVHFTPVIDNESKEVKVKELDIQLESSGILSTGLNWVLQSFIKTKIEELVQNQVDKNLKKVISQYLSKNHELPLPDDLQAQIRIEDARLHRLEFLEGTLYLNVEAHGKLKLRSKPK
jgi:hypothetical protein